MPEVSFLPRLVPEQLSAMLWAGLGFMFLSMRKVDLFGGKFSSDWRSVSASCVCTAVSLISRHCTTNLKPVPGILVHSYTVKMMVGDEQAAQLPRKSLLTLDQQNSCSDIFVSISGLIGIYMCIYSLYYFTFYSMRVYKSTLCIFV